MMQLVPYVHRAHDDKPAEALHTESLRILGLKDGDIVKFLDLGGSFM